MTQHKPGEMIEVKPGAPAPRFIPPTQLQRLAAPFGGKDVKTRGGRGQGGPELTYIGIDATIRRLNEVLGADWSIRDARTSLDPIEDGERFVATVELYLDVVLDGTDKTAFGVGADRDKDPDKALKTALAEAIKKAGHQLGIALYLWDEAGRKAAQSAMALANGGAAAMKREVFRIAKEELGTDKPSVATIAKHFGKKAGDLSDEATLRAILEERGLL